MPTPLEYMQFATGVYAASDENSLADPAGWVRTAWQPDQGSGFSAGYYINSQSNEVVISYTGTNDLMDAVNWTTGIGLPLPQIYAAVDYYFKVKAEHPDADITFTGHSLGGGLASLMAVFFNKQATVFDEAPFQPAAVSPFVLPFVGAQMLIAGYQDSAFSTYLLSAGLLALTRETNVTQYYVEGEVLSIIRFSENTLVGSSDNPILMGNSTASMVDRHSMALMTALQYSPELLQVVRKLPDLVTVLLNPDLFATDARNPSIDLLRRLLRHQIGITDAVQPDGMLDRFTSDMNKIAQDGGLSFRDSPWNTDSRLVSDTLIALAMQMYYEDTANATDPNKELFTQITGGLQLDLGDVSKDFKTAFEAPETVDGDRKQALIDALSEVKGFEQYFKNYIIQSGNFSAEETSQISSFLPYMRDWYVQAGTAGMNATDTQNRGAFMLGGFGKDTLTGGTADDLLVGNADGDFLDGGKGNDILLGGEGFDNLKGGDGVDLLIGGQGNDDLDGGAGNDLLKGGEGYDTYTFISDYGTDIVTDSDSMGAIIVDGHLLGSANQTSESVYKETDSGQTVVKLNGGTSLVILKEGDANRILINNWPGSGLVNLQDTTSAAPAVTLAGDFKKKIDDHGTPGTSDDTYKIANGNYVEDDVEANALDLLTGTAGNDVIDGKGGDDALSGKGGDDYLIGGEGGDAIQGGLGKDTIIGGGRRRRYLGFQRRGLQLAHAN